MNDFARIPLGIADFSTIRRKNFLYADKTELVYKLVSSGSPFFHSRPRRFGKSLLVSTLKTLLKGGEDNKKLFEGLWIGDHTDYDFTPNPVIHLSLSSIATQGNLANIKINKDDFQDDDFPSGLTKEQKIEQTKITIAVNQELRGKLKTIARDENLSLEDDSSARMFEELINLIYSKYSLKVAILIDEYDAPILSEIESTNRANAVRNVLKSFYGVLKDNDERCGFTFITGVTKFTKTSIFSTLNNLIDLTL
ncbi:MAG: AAA family ATPase, partial [Deltaproteobacteria bacterium]|nr:AAA family ATPase [Deltaproteobacteria bacterium]